LLDLVCDGLERLGIGHFPPEELDPGAAVGFDDHALPAIVHPECCRPPAVVDQLEAQHARAVRFPFVERRRVKSDVAQ
jgi:hypothetical protein